MKVKSSGIGDRIREKRKEHKLSQRELAEMVHVSPSHLSDIENGKKTIGIEILMRITEALQVSSDWLLRTNIPSVGAIEEKELSDILGDCDPAERQAITKIARAAKTAMREKDEAKKRR
jgi:transcriptional regulator with XRE-family HTH domain